MDAEAIATRRLVHARRRLRELERSQRSWDGISINEERELRELRLTVAAAAPPLESTLVSMAIHRGSTAGPARPG